MTREEAARELDDLLLDDVTNERLALEEVEALTLAAAALRQTCGGCKHFSRHETRRGQPVDQPLKWVQCDDRSVAVYQFDNDDILPRDGSGFCHRWEAK